MSWKRVLLVAASVAAVWMSARQVSAYGYESPVSDGCHEAITAEALRRVREALPAAGPLSSTATDRILLDELPFGVASDMEDVGALALLVGVRDNDLKGQRGIDSSDLALIHGDDDGQREHCLRRSTQDDPRLDAPVGDDPATGTELALAECRGFVREKVMRAISEGLDTQGRPDEDRRLPLPVHLSFSGRQVVDLPVFYVYMGQALHTLQDSFTHTFRTEDTRRVKVVLNWVDFAENEIDQRRDGPPHIVAMDQCRNQDDRLKDRLEALKSSALRASEEMLRAALTGPVDTREAAVDAVLDDWMQPEPDCTIDNAWCEAPEAALIPGPGCACRAGPGHRTNGTAAGLLLAAALLVVGRSRRRRAARARAAGAMWLGVLLTALASGRAAAQAEPSGGSVSSATAATTAASFEGSGDVDGATQAASNDPHATGSTTPATLTAPTALACVPGRQVACACPGGVRGAQRCLPDGRGYDACGPCASVAVAPDDAHPGMAEKDAISEAISRISVYAAVGAALDNSALAFSGAGRYRLSDDWLVGVDGEFNPWFSLDTHRFVLGAANVYGTLIRRYVISDAVALRSTLHLGVSVLLVDLIGAPAGSTGLYAGLNLLGIELAITRSIRLVIDPADVAIPVPHLTGAPLSYRQYRFTIGLQIGS